MTRKILSVFFMLLLVIAAPSIVRAEGEVCEIVGGTSYTTLQGALDVVETGQTIKLLGHINHSSGISISGKHITFELSSFTLSVTNDKGVALEVYSDGIVALDSTGGGAFNVIGSTYGVYAHDGGQATVTNSTSIDTDSYGVYAFKNGNITVNENATSNGQYGHAVHSEQYGTVRVKGNAIGTNSSSFAVYAYNYGTVTVDGNAAGIYVGAYDKYYGSITVGGDATGSYCGVWANNNGAVTVYGNAAGTGSSAASRGVCAENNSKVIIYGDASGVDTGVYAEESNIEVYGNSIATSTFSGYGVRGVSFSTITIGGNVQGRDGGIHSFESVVSVEGNVQSQMCGIYATYAEVKVKGSVSSSVTGVKVGAGKVWVDGSISAPTYIDVNSVIKIAADGEISGNYYKYNSNMAYAYVKIPPAIKGISTDSSTILSIGGNILVTLSGINMPDNVVVSAFYGETVKLTGYAIGDSSSKTVNLSFPAVEAGTIEDMSYIIKASLDGGISWAAVTATVVERHAPIPVTAITVTSESDAITLLTGNSLQMTAVINPVDADFTGVIWSVQPVSGSATITDTGVLTGTAEGTITVTATAIDGTGINSKLTINVLTKPVLSGTVAILGAAKYGETLTADITGITYTPATGADVFKYQWKRNGIIISGATSETYTLVLADIDKTITLTIMADGINAIGSVSASTTVQRADGPPAPEPPTLNVKTHNSVTLNTISGMNYKKEGDSYWYVSSYFYGLLPNKTYAFTTRIGQTQTHYSSVASAPLYVTTDPAPFHTVTYYPNDGAETPTIERSVQEGTTFVTESSDSFIAPLEMLFKQWNTKPDGSGIGYSAGATVNMLNGDFSLHAIWEAATYTVIYCANGGTGTAPVQANMIKGATFQSAASDSFTAPIEKQFKEWNTQADGSGDYYAAEVTVTMPSGGLTLHAIWEKIQYPVTYYGNGGTGMAPIEANKAKDDIFQAATSDSFTPPVEKQFKKWNTQSNGGGISYMAGANVTMPSGGLNLYAIWEVATYPITYYANNGTEATLSGSKRAAGQTFQTAASDSFAAPVEKRFKEWNIQADGGGTSYAAGVDVITPSGGQKLYAIWEVVTYSVTYHANNWSYATITGSSLAKGATFTAEVNTFTAPFEKRFKEWNTKSDGSGTGYLAGTIVTMSSENLDLHAIWEIITHTVEYNGNENTEGSTPVDGNKYVYYSNFTISAPGDLVKSGHSLICWNTELDGTGADYWVGLTYQMSTTDLILYAKWTPYVSGDFTDVNFKQAIWEWLGNPIGSTPGDFTQYDLKKRVPYKPYCELYVDGKGIASLAGLEHFNDTMLKSFSCSNNPLTSLPTLPEGLEGLSCGNNQLTSLPTLPDGLQDLYCNNNQLTSLPALPDGLKSLSCDNNQLTSLPTLPDSLDTLICNNTQLTSLPALPGSLQYLFCDDNQLANLPTLPSSLQYLRCYGNQLTSLPTLPSSLKYLYCYGNLLTGLPVLPSGLSQLVCSNNYMDVFSDPLKTMIDNCSASDKNIFPQYRYMSRKDKIDMITSNSYSFADELYMLYINATESSNWEGEIYDITQFDFSSSDTNIVTINQDGVLTAIGDGSCTITALYHGINSKLTKVELNVTAYSVYNFMMLSILLYTFFSNSSGSYCFYNLPSSQS